MNTRKKLYQIGIFTSLLLLHLPVHAATININNPIQAKSIPQLINNIVRVILGIVGAIALFMFVYGGLLWMTSAGNEQRITKGRETLTWATIGLIIIFASYAILNAIFTAIGGQ